MQYVLTKESITLYHENGESVIVASDNMSFQQIVACVKTGDFKEAIELAQPTRKVLKVYNDSKFEVWDGIVFVNGTDLPRTLSERLIKFAEQGLDYTPLLNFWDKLMVCSNRVVNELFSCLERNHHPIFEDGDFLAWKGVRNDFTDMYSGTYDNTPGKFVSMPVDQVDYLNQNSCSHGLHVGSFEYARNFGRVLLEVKVNPENVVAVPTDCNHQKMRVCEYESLRVIAGDVQDLDQVVGGGAVYMPWKY